METTLADKLVKAGKKLPILVSARLTLRPFVFDDAHDVFDYAKDEEVAVYTTFNAHTSMKDSYYFLFDIVLPSYERGEIGPYAIDFEGKVIGAIELRTLNSHIRTHTREIGIVLNHHYWGKGFITEAGKTLLEYVFNQTNVYRVFGCVEAENHNSIRALERLGFQYEGRERSGRVLKSHYVDLVHYSILKDEWVF